MGIMDWLKNQSTSLQNEVKRFKNRSFMEAAVAGCAMVAAADGVIRPEEKQKMAGFIQRNDALKVFDMNDVIKTFDKFTQGFEFDAQIGKGEALKAIGKVRKNSEEARLLVRVCCAIGAADGDFDPDEKKVVRQICRELDLDPADFELGESSGPNLRK